MLYSARSTNGTTLIPCASGTSLRTLLQVLTPSTVAVEIKGWGVSFDGVTATAVPGICSLLSCSGAASSLTAMTPGKWGRNATAVPASLCVGGTAATGYNSAGGGSEGSPTALNFLDGDYVHPQTGYSIWFPDGPIVEPSRSIRIRVTYAVTVNCLPWIVWDEAA